MKTLLAILRAAHCRSTHHFFALDALPLVQTGAGRRLTSWLLRHHDRYLTGAKDPDTRFRDFQNHVVHVGDGYWGGAPRVAHQWHDRMMRYLDQGRYGDAAHAAGVISHYFTDPIQPLHTAQTPREKILHRPIEWSICKSYDQIYRLWLADDSRVLFRLSEGRGWLGEAILHAAKFSHKRYGPMADRYRLDLGVDDPPAGFDDEGRRMIADLFGIAITGWARILERIAMENEIRSGRSLPTASLSIPAALAAIKVPARWWIRRISDKREQAAVTALVDEFTRTGKLVENLPAEVDIIERVLKVRHDELAWKERRIARAESSQTSVSIETPAVTPSPATLPFPGLPRAGGETAADPPSLAADDPLVDAPSIGPKTAERFAAIGVHTVDDFLTVSAETMAAKLATRWITSDTIKVWQDQARLMGEMPRTLAREVQLLVGAGYTDVNSIAGADSKRMQADIQAFARTSSGRRYLRGAPVPTTDRIDSWTKLPAKSSSDRRRAA